MKKIITAAFMIILGMTFLGCSNTTQEVTTTGLDYEMFNYISDYDEVFNRREGTYLVYFYSATCANCIAIKNTVLTFANTYTAHTIYFFNVDNATADLKTEFLTLIGVSSSKFGTPSLIIVKDFKFDKTAQSNYYFSGATDIPPALRDIQNGTYQYF